MTIERELAGLGGPIPAGLTESVALGTGLAEGYDLYPSAVGEVVVTFNPEGVSTLDLAEGDYLDRFYRRTGKTLIRAEAPRAWARHLPTSIEAGTPGKVPVDLRPLTRFQAQVLRVTSQIPRGEVRPYRWLAKEVLSPRATRAVGSVMSHNPIPLILPCHRVVRSDGHMGNYSLGGPHLKLHLLEHEGADPARLERLARAQVKVQGDMETRVFCLPSCHVVRSARRVVDFGDPAEAHEEGFVPCGQCRPV
ncbi:MAG: methylated-DNA--[protein]-cysteine S-methyltransferase [Actinobacteria bacterium]|nr:methylated-DNA--[protein]-cysteine S-methyltransferase [Actinomycetota bacterium]MCI0543894.1 methylated-DNA--[protein]-cysteine S-methyltransferase [Actinomycetota bacterium]MCI0679089.1 methylated-DNA--[protein]-cysteine S-methyltransferase [Actinomycetota bacterium]